MAVSRDDGPAFVYLENGRVFEYRHGDAVFVDGTRARLDERQDRAFKVLLAFAPHEAFHSAFLEADEMLRGQTSEQASERFAWPSAMMIALRG